MGWAMTASELSAMGKSVTSLMKAGNFAKIMAAIGVIVSVVDIVMTWTSTSPTLKAMRETEEKLKNSRKQLRRLMKHFHIQSKKSTSHV